MDSIAVVSEFWVKIPFSSRESHFNTLNHIFSNRIFLDWKSVPDVLFATQFSTRKFTVNCIILQYNEQLESTKLNYVESTVHYDINMDYSTIQCNWVYHISGTIDELIHNYKWAQ